MTLGDFNRAVEGYQNRLKARAEQTDTLNHLLGHYIAFAQHDPKHYPDSPLLSKPQEINRSPEAFRQIAKKRWRKK